MIPRYTRPEMAAVWTPEARYRLWYEIEAYACDARARLGEIPPEAARAVWEGGRRALERLDLERLAAREAETRHDVVAFLDYLGEHIGEPARHLHLGLTSSDILDTCLAVQLSRASEILLDDVEHLLAVLERRAFEHKTTPCVGRSHGVHAAPTTFGLKLAGAYAEFARGRERLERARWEVATCKLSGAVGTYATVNPRVETYVAERLGLALEPVSTQVVPRDRHAAFFGALAVVASSIERLATEIRHLQRTEVGEAEERFAPGQKGSSVMPHKRNPVLSENLTGLARLVRAAVMPALENVALWHERDISHSSVERVIAPDATVALDFALVRLADVVDGLVVRPDAMRRNLERLGGLVYSQHVLCALKRAGLSREAAYDAVQRNAMRVWDEGGSLRERLAADAEVARVLSAEALAALFDLGEDLRHVDTIFERVFGRC